ncbi:hypothetical protein [Sphingomonas sanxanigenens]|uniref:hypothetical protein n=1 Tax=Sphingomonas sanxanigenens TaxID=397260 RepID=UPI001FE14425|nr:hypothetical protein [Sphingomonas sanxanigenens]
MRTLVRAAGPPHLGSMTWRVTLQRKWCALGHDPRIRVLLCGLGWLLIALTPLVGPLPGPGGIIVFAAGLGLVLRNSAWAKRRYVRFKRRHPGWGDWADWGLRRASARRRIEICRERRRRG